MKKLLTLLLIFCAHFVNAQNDTTIYSITDKMPVYTNGNTEGLISFLKENFKKPNTDTASGRLIVSFVVEKDGTTSNSKIEKGLTTSLNNEALRVVEMLRFRPAKNKGNPVRSKFTLPFSIKY